MGGQFRRGRKRADVYERVGGRQLGDVGRAVVSGNHPRTEDGPHFFSHVVVGSLVFESKVDRVLPDNVALLHRPAVHITQAAPERVYPDVFHELLDQDVPLASRATIGRDVGHAADPAIKRQRGGFELWVLAPRKVWQRYI